MLKVTYSKRFLKNFKKLTENEKSQIKIKIKQILRDPRHPSLRTKKIKGLKNIFESSVNMDIRLVWTFQGINLIVALDIGHHDILNDY